jgi:plastocyanin
MKLADPPDQVFQVKRGPTPPDQIFDVRAITNRQVVTAEPPFMVTVFAEPPDQIFQVKKGPDVPDTIFTVRRGPSAPDDTFQVSIVNRLVVRVSWPVPDTIFTVTTGPDPAPTPDQIFGVSVGGPDAPPIPDPDQTFDVTTGPAIPVQIFDTQVISAVFGVLVQREPFIVTVGPSAPDTTYTVTTGAPMPDQTFVVLRGADPPDQTFGISIIQEAMVDVADAPIQYAVSANGASAYVFTGNGLSAEENPPLYLSANQLVTFALQAPGHPFWICATQTTGGCPGQPAWASYLSNNGAEEGNIRIRISQPGLYFYNCGIHSMMSGTITVT